MDGVQYDIGDTISYSTFGGSMRVVLVQEKDEDIKNGRPGFSGEIASGPDKGQGVWGYDDQIERVVERAK